METMLTIQQVAEELGVSKSRVFQYIREGRLEAQRVGIQDLILRTHLDSAKSGLRKTVTGRPKAKPDEGEAEPEPVVEAKPVAKKRAAKKGTK